MHNVMGLQPIRLIRIRKFEVSHAFCRPSLNSLPREAAPVAANTHAFGLTQLRPPLLQILEPAWKRAVGPGKPPDAMIRYTEIAFTAYAVTDMPRARKFYEDVLCLKPSRELSENFIEYDLGPGTLVVACAPEQWPPSDKGTAAALEVEDFPSAIEHLKKHKVDFAIGPMDFPTCNMVGVRDPDGNMITLHKRKEPPAGAQGAG